MRYPGALHKASWMSKLLYTLKIVLLSAQIKEHFQKAEIVTSTQIRKLERFVVFTVSVKFAEHDSTLVENAYMVFSRHTWYLAEELIQLALFSSMVAVETKEEMRKSILFFEKSSVTKRVGLNFGGYGKPYLPPTIEYGTSLVDLIGPDSFRFFSIFGMPYKFLYAPAHDWINREDYQNMKLIVDKLQVVNEAAERGLKECHDFLGVTRDEKRFQDVFQVVEFDRQRIPNQRKRFRAQKEKSWFLV